MASDTVVNDSNSTRGRNDIAAIAATRFNNFEEIQAKRGKVSDSDSADYQTQLIQSKFMMFESAASRIEGLDFDGRRKAQNSVVHDLAKVVANNGEITFERVKKALSGYNNTDQVVRQGMDILKTIKEGVTDYFEAKPQRAVKISEFAGAVVPKGTSPKLIERLKKEGLEVKEYEEGRRTEAVKELTNSLQEQRGDVLYSKNKQQKSNEGNHTVESAREDISEFVGKESLEALEESGLVNLSHTDEETLRELGKIGAVKASINELEDPDNKGKIKDQLNKYVKGLVPEGMTLEVIVEKDGSVISLGRAGLKHSAFGQRPSAKNALCVLHVKDLIKKSVTDGRAFEKNDPTERKVGGTITYYSGIDIDGEVLGVTIRVSRAKGYRGTGLSLYNIRAENNKTSSPESVGRKSPPQLNETGGLDSIVPQDSLDVKYSKEGKIQGIYDPRTGKSYIIAGNIKKGEAKGVFMHEVGVHMAADQQFRKVMEPILKRGLQIVVNGNANGDPIAKEAYKKLVEAGESTSNANEASAYLAQVAVNAKKLSGPIARWVRQLKAAINAWLINHNFRNVDKLTTQDIVDIALSNVRAMAKQSIRDSKHEYQRPSLQVQFAVTKNQGPGNSHSPRTSWGLGPMITCDEFGNTKFGWSQ